MRSYGPSPRRLIALLLSAFLLLGTFLPSFPARAAAEPPASYVEGQAFFLAGSQEEAQAVADQYGCPLLSYSYGVGILGEVGDELPQAPQAEGFTAYGTELPALSRNYYVTAFGTTDSGTQTVSRYQSELIRAGEAWAVTTGQALSDSAPVKVAVIDSGVDKAHPDLAGKLAECKSFFTLTNPLHKDDSDPTRDFVGHGTHVAGIIAAEDNQVGVVGTAPGAELYVYKALDYTTTSPTEATGSFADIIAAINYAVDTAKVDIINMSLGAPKRTGSTEGLDDAAVAYLQTAVDKAVTAGVLVICAAGNADTNLEAYPAACEGVVAVASSNVRDESHPSLVDGALSYFSNYGTWVDVAAPGHAIYSTLPGGAYGYMSGTSMAAPVVSAVAALVRAVKPGVRTESELLDYLKRSSALTSGNFTHPIINADAAVQAAYAAIYPAALSASDVDLSERDWTAGTAIDEVSLFTLSGLSGGSGGYRCALLEGGPLPDGLTLSPVGVLAGTPTSPSGAVSLTLRFSDAKNPQYHADISLRLPSVAKEIYGQTVSGSVTAIAGKAEVISYDLASMKNHPGGGVTYTYTLGPVGSGSGLLAGDAALDGSVLRLSTNAVPAGTTAVLPVTLHSERYADIEAAVTVTAAAVTPVRWGAEGSELSAADITYGQALASAVKNLPSGSAVMAVNVLGEVLSLNGAYSVTDGGSIPAAGENQPVVVTFTSTDGDYSARYSGLTFSREFRINVTPMDIEGAVALTGSLQPGAVLAADLSGLLPEAAREGLTYAWTLGGIAAGTGSTLTLPDDCPGKEVTLTVTGTGNYAGTLTVRTSIPAAAPAQPVLTVEAGTEQVVLRWNAPGDGGSPITGYTVSISENGTSFTDTALGVGARSHTYSTLAGGKTCFFRLTATNAVGSTASEVVSATPAAAQISDPGGGGGGGGGAPVKQPALAPVEEKPPEKPPEEPQLPAASQRFTDLTPGAWYEEAVDFVTARGLFQGSGDGSFAPGAGMTRAMVWTILARLDGQDPKGSDLWYSEALSWAVDRQVSDGSNPDSPVSRQEFALMLYRLKGSPAVRTDLSGYSDAERIAPWAMDAMSWAVEQGLFTGREGGALAPEAGASRAEIAVLFFRYLSPAE